MGCTRRAVLAACIAAPAAASAADGVTQVARGVFVRRGFDAEATRSNANGIANACFVIGRDAVVVVDPGGSLIDGARLRRAIRARTDRPITHVVLNHDHPDHVFGASAFLADRPAVVGHHRLAESLLIRGAYDRARLVGMLGDEAAGQVMVPTIAVRDRLVIPLGGRTLMVTAHPPAHTRCDLSMIDDASGLLFTGDLLFVRRVPAIDGSLTGWLAVLDGLVATRAVPGHGPAVVDTARVVAALRRYLTILRDETRAAIAAGVGIERAADTIGLSERPHWRLFDAYHRRNVIAAYKELEWE